MNEPLTWRPGKDYEPVRSAVEGISVFRRVGVGADTPGAAEPRQDSTAPEPAVQTGRSSETSLNDRDVPASRTGATASHDGWSDFRPDTMPQLPTGWGVDMRESRCVRCAIAIAAHPNREPDCPWCSEPLVGTSAAIQAVRPTLILDFEVSDEEVAERLTNWYSSRPFRPPGFEESTMDRHIERLYLPFWLVHAAVEGMWEGEVPHEETRTVRRHGETETESYTVWRHEREAIRTNGYLLALRAISSGVAQDVSDGTAFRGNGLGRSVGVNSTP